jgi:hypothetical protein
MAPDRDTTTPIGSRRDDIPLSRWRVGSVPGLARELGILGLVLLFLSPATARPASAEPAPSPQSASDEYVVKAAFVYNFILFVDWPPAAFPRVDDPVVVCIVGRDPSVGELRRTLAGRSARGRSLVVRDLEWGPELRRCHVLFFRPTALPLMRELPALLGAAPVLSIADEIHGGGGDCIIGFAFEDHRVEFDINIDQADRAGLSISSKVLRLARNRRSGAAKGGAIP